MRLIRSTLSLSALLIPGFTFNVQAQINYCTPTFSPGTASAATEPIFPGTVWYGNKQYQYPSSATVSTTTT